MSEPLSAASTPETLGLNRPRIPRIRYLIDPRRQLRTTLMTTSLTVAVVLVVNFGFAFLRTSQTAFLTAAAPQLTPLLEEQNTTFSLTMIILSIVLVIAVALTTIIHTHRTAGAVFAVRQRLDRVKAGDLQVTLKLRQRDNLQDLETPFNEMIVALRDREVKEADILEQLALKAASIGPGAEGVTAGLSELSRKKRQVGT